VLKDLSIVSQRAFEELSLRIKVKKSCMDNR